MRHWWKVAVAVPLVGAVLWGLGLPGRAAPGGRQAPAAVAARERAAALKLKIAKEKAKIAQEAAFQAVHPKGSPEFDATFSGSSLDTSIWQTCYPEADFTIGCTNFGNKEYQWYLASQDRVSGRVLRLVAQRRRTPGQAKPAQAGQAGRPKEYLCRSGIVTTYSSLQFKYGFLQIVAKIPHRSGLWSGLWLAAADGVWPPEMDMIESWGVKNETASFFHPSPAGAHQDRGLIPIQLTTGWQTYSLSWTRSKMEYFVNDVNVLTITKRIPHQLMYVLADLAEYQKPRAGNCSGQLDIRSVKYWKY